MIPVLGFHPPIIAHRGAVSLAPENTLAAIRAAREQGVNWVEVDVKITYDGVPILIHDEVLDRTTNGTGLVAQTSWSDLSRLDVKAAAEHKYRGETIPHLSDAVNAALQHNLGLIVELKPCPGRAKATTMVAMIEIAKIWPEGDDVYPVISSFDLESLEISAQLEPHWPRCVLMEEWDEAWADKIAQAQACALSLGHTHVTPERVAAVQAKGIPLLAYTVNDPQRAKELLAWGVAAVYADNPRAILNNL